MFIKTRVFAKESDNNNQNNNKMKPKQVSANARKKNWYTDSHLSTKQRVDLPSPGERQNGSDFTTIREQSSIPKHT